MVISVCRDDGTVYQAQAEETLTGRTHEGNLRIAFISADGRIVGAIELSPTDAEFLEGASARTRARITATKG